MSSEPATTIYDEIGQRYSRHRRSDPRIARAITSALGDARTVVNVGAGTGSYEPGDRQVVAVEPSSVMIAQRGGARAPVVQAVAEHLPFPDQGFDAALASLTVHHWPDLARGLAEMNRVARRRVVFTYEPEIHDRFWLIREYIPEAGHVDPSWVITIDDVAGALGATRVEPVLVPHDCVDGFFCAYWRRPEAYLDEEVRSCISGLARADPDAVADGVARLEADLATGDWHRRHADLLDREEIDGGFRLVIADG